MQFLVNDLSMAGQFPNLAVFQQAVARIMLIRRTIQQHGYALSCHLSLASAQVTHDLVMQQAVGRLPIDVRRAWMIWLTQQGPHWEDERIHHGDDWLEVDGKIVTESAAGEAAVCCSRGLRRELVSFDPSSWLRTPLVVRWIRDDGANDDIPVPNHWEHESVERTLQANPQPVGSWSDLAARSVQRCSQLVFSEDAFTPLDNRPFVPSAAERIRVLLNTLNRLKSCFDESGSRSAEGHRLVHDHFSETKHWFSDSSESEKRRFKKELTFRDPRDTSKTLFCTWHGKVKTPQYRIHFSWPVNADTPLCVVYIGPKLTKR